jgi:hypothetical protein
MQEHNKCWYWETLVSTTGTSYVQFGDEAGDGANHYRGYMLYAMPTIQWV